MTDRRSRLASELAEALRAYGETSASRRMKWGSAYDHARMTGDNITTVRSVADRAVMHIESEMDRLRGEIDALRVEIEQVDYEIRNGEPA